MNLFQRTMKLTVATIVATVIAMQLGMANASVAGVIALLSVFDTRRASLDVAIRRVVAAVLAFMIAVGSFTMVGYTLVGLVVYLLVYIPLVYSWKIEMGLVPNTVLVIHLYAAGEATVSLLVNEALLLGIGVAVALCVNVYMPSQKNRIIHYRLQVEKQLRIILMRFHQFLVQGDGTNEAKLIKELYSVLSQAKVVVYQEQANRLFTQTNYDLHYFEMREEQTRILESMAIAVNRCFLDLEENKLLASLFYLTAEQLSETNTAVALLANIDELLEHFRMRPLPQTREEFENRALLFQLLNDLTRFIEVKVRFYKEYGGKESDN